MTLWENLVPLSELTQSVFIGMMLVFIRVSAIIALLPGFGEQSIPVRIRLAIALAFTILVWPALGVGLDFTGISIFSVMPLIVSEAMIGVIIGLSIRLVLMALQFAATISSQSMSLTQMMGAAATPDPMPAMGNMLIMAGLVLAFATGLHVKAVSAMITSYVTLPMGSVPDGADIVAWGIAKSSAVFSLAFTLAGPFVIASFAYNLALGAINRAMPQLMVAFIGAPAITAGAILILLLAGPAILTSWNSHLDDALSNPLGYPR